MASNDSIATLSWVSARSLALIAGLVLLFACYAKLMLLFDPAWRFLSSSSDITLLFAAVILDIAVSWLLIFNSADKRSHLAGLILFSGFAYYQFYAIFFGSGSCDCFGDFFFPPRAILVMDAGFAMLFLISYSALNFQVQDMRFKLTREIAGTGKGFFKIH